MRKVYLTTKDNPFNPNINYKSWLQFDIENGYNSCEYLGRIARTSDDLTEFEYNQEIERAIDEIIKYDFTNNYTKLVVEDPN